MRCSYCLAEFSKLLGLKEIFGINPLVISEMCASCLLKFEKIVAETRCVDCMKKSSKKVCDDCRNWKKIYSNYCFKHEALFDYNEEMQEWFQQYKFKGNRNLCYGFSGEINAYFQKKKHCLIVPIPLSKEGMIERGFNQVEELLKAASIPYESVLKKRGTTMPQSSKNKMERLQSEQPFTLDVSKESLYKDRSIVIVDDVYTTGRTIFHGAELLLENGAKNVTSFSLAR